MESTPLLSLAEVQERLGLSRSSLLRLVTAGKLRGRKVGLRRGSWRISEADIDAYREHDALFTVTQAHARLSVSPSTVRRLIYAGKLPAHRVGQGRGQWRVRGADLTSYIDGAGVSVDRVPARHTATERHMR